jgi:hypothetical protein
MAQRRMFSLKIVGSDAFLDMPVSVRELYFQLGMYADDDGFINPKKVIRMIGSADDDLKMLIAKRFVLPFENGVVVIKHWAINNLIRKDFYQETLYTEQKKLLATKENKAYTEAKKKNVNKMLTNCHHSIGKDRIGKVSKDNTTEQSSDWDSDKYIESLCSSTREDLKIVGHYMKIKKLKFPSKKTATAEFGRNIKSAGELSEYSKEKRTLAVNQAAKMTKQWTLLTVCKYINK